MSNTTTADEVGLEERPGSFLAGAWMNRRWTRSCSSIMLGLVPTALLIMSGGGQLPVIGPALMDVGVLTEGTVLVVGAVTATIALVNLLLLPFARECYFRATMPMRDGMGEMVTFGILFIIVMAAKIAMFLVIWAMSIPLGLVGLAVLGDEDRQGLGWRIN